MRRRFPDYGWAWPTGDRDTLLKAILTPDEETARAHAIDWLARNDIDTATFATHRLLAALADRFGGRLSASPAYPRLIGLQKLLWSRSNLALSDSRETLAALSAAGCRFMLIKGAARMATDPSALRGRVAHDIDILLHPEDMSRAADILLDRGWQTFSGAGNHRVRMEIAATRSINFFRGNSGDLDLHSSAYFHAQASAEDDANIWRRAVPVTVAGTRTLAPSAGDRIAMAIAHGSLGAHAHSDWLVDIAAAITQSRVDWAALLVTLQRRKLLVPAASALGYLRYEIGCAVPDDTLAELIDLADRSGPLRALALLEAKPRADFNIISAAARGLAKHIRLLREHEPTGAASSAEWRSWRARPAPEERRSGELIATFPVPESQRGSQAIDVEIVLRVTMPAVRRRIELELSTASRHLARLRHFKALNGGGTRDLTFRGTVELRPGEEALILESRPSRNFRFWTTAEARKTYGELEFAVVRAEFRPA